jgi:hypothetical protein
MHWLGKLCLGFLALAALFAIYLTVGLLKARGYWQQQAQAAEAAYETTAKDLGVKRTQVDNLQEQVVRSKLGWGNVWMAGNSRVNNPNTGAVSIGTGSSQGLAQREQGQNALVHIFSAEQGSEPQYLGAFQIQSLQAGSADAVRLPPPPPNFNMPSGTWRIREEIPYNFSTRFMELETHQMAALSRLQRMQYDIQRLQEEKVASETLLKEREYELNGDPNLMDPTPLQKDGLVQSLRLSLAQRDQLLQQLQALRLERLQKQEALEGLLESNRQRVAQYEQRVGANGPASTASGAAAPQ